jgi:hypothetical protein
MLMGKKIFWGAIPIIIVFMLGLGINALAQDKPDFGTTKDVNFADSLWKAMQGYDQWPMKSDIYPGNSPHGKFLRLYFNSVNVNGKNYLVVVKDNFGGENVTKEMVVASPNKYLVAVTPMVWMEPGYAPKENNLYWVKYAADGSVMKTPQGMAIAGKVKSCVDCHARAKDGDYMFTNDK